MNEEGRHVKKREREGALLFFLSSAARRSGVGPGGVEEKGACGSLDSLIRTATAAWDAKKSPSDWPEWSIRGVMPLPGHLSQTPTNAVHLHRHRRRRRRRHQDHETNDSRKSSNNNNNTTTNYMRQVDRKKTGQRTMRGGAMKNQL